MAAAAAGRAPPATPHQGRAHLGGHHARPLRHVRPGVPERDLARGNVGVVPPDIARPELLGVRGAPVELDHHAKRLIEHILVLPSSAAPYLVLPGADREAMWPFDPVQVPEFEQ